MVPLLYKGNCNVQEWHYLLLCLYSSNTASPSHKYLNAQKTSLKDALVTKLNCCPVRKDTLYVADSCGS